MNGGRAARWGSLLLLAFGCGKSARDFGTANHAGAGNGGATSANGGSGGHVAGSGGTGASTPAGDGGTADAGESSAGGPDENAGAAGSDESGGATNFGGSSSGGTSAIAGSPAVAGAGNGGSGAGAGGAGSAGAPAVVTVQLTQTRQTIEGFGINDSFAGEAWTSAVADHLFTTDGIGLSLLRVGMGPDGGLVTSSIQSSDMALAKARGAKIIGTTWSPPAVCKTNNSENDGGHLLQSNSCADKWSEAIAKFAGDLGLYAMSIASEPDFASCGNAEPCNGNFQSTVYTANELVAFAKKAGPKLQARGVKVIVGEASQWLHTWSNVSATGSVPSNQNSSDPLRCGFPPSNPSCDTGEGYDYGHWLAKDADAWSATDILGVHQFYTQRGEPWPSDVRARKPVWMTEMSGVKWWPEQGMGSGSSLTGSKTIENGVAVAGWIHSALVVGDASAWLWWWYKAYFTDDNEGLYNKNGDDTKRHYALGNYSKFVRPGYIRVDVTGPIPTDVLVSAFKGEDGTLVLVAINKGATAVSGTLAIAGGTAPVSMTPWVTSATLDLKPQTPVAVSGGKFTAVLAAMSVTTFVGK
jgi:glucuronoarabinoxylan endo-1,4-beta-xylanase